MEPKRIFIQLVLLASFIQILTAQSYNSVSTGRECMFENLYGYKAIRIDSVFYSGDTAWYFNFRTLRNSGNFECYLNGKPSWLGKYVIVCPDGDNLFFNKNNDTIRIKTAALAGESWECFRYSNGNYIESTLGLVSVESFLGITDSVKTFTFQLKNSGGNNISHPINQEVLKISKEYGMVRALNFYLYPDLNESGVLYEYFGSYDLIGISNPYIGFQNLTWSETFNYNIGDEIHSLLYYFSNPPWNANSTEKIVRVLDKYLYPMGDTVAYSVEVCTRNTIETGTNLIVTSHHDTSVMVIPLENSFFDVLPDEPAFYPGAGDMQFLMNGIFQSGLQMKIVPVDYIFIASDSCYGQLMIDGVPDEYYIAGIGGPYWEAAGFVNIFNYHKLMYYKKGDTEWGTPYNCDSLLLSEKEVIKADSEISLFPNPANESFFIEVNNPENLPAKLIVTDLVGNIVIAEQIARFKTEVNCRNLLSGMYLYQLVLKTEKITSGKVIVQ